MPVHFVGLTEPEEDAKHGLVLPMHGKYSRPGDEQSRGRSLKTDSPGSSGGVEKPITFFASNIPPEEGDHF